IVLVGTTAKGIYDLRSTPFSPVYPGTEIHATVIDNILAQHFVTRPQWSQVYDLLAVIILGVLIGSALPRVGALRGLVFATGLVIVHIFVARWLFVKAGVWLNIVYPLLVLSLNYTVLTVYHYAVEERERKKIRGTFEYLCRPRGGKKIGKPPGKPHSGGGGEIPPLFFLSPRGFSRHFREHRAPPPRRFTQQIFHRHDRYCPSL